MNKPLALEMEHLSPLGPRWDTWGGGSIHWELW